MEGYRNKIRGDNEKQNRLKEALKLKGMTQTELAKRTGVKRTSINHWVSQHWQPKQHALLKMAQVLDVSEMWLAGYDVEKERPVEEIRISKLANHIHRLKNNEKLLNLSISLCELNSDQLNIIENMVAELAKIKSQN